MKFPENFHSFFCGIYESYTVFYFKVIRFIKNFFFLKDLYGFYVIYLIKNRFHIYLLQIECEKK